MLSIKTIHNVCLPKQGLCVAKQSLCIFQTEAHSCKERSLSSSNRAYVWTKQGICICLIWLFVFFMQLCLNPGYSDCIALLAKFNLKGKLLFSSVGPVKLIHWHWLCSASKCNIFWLNIGLRVYLDLYLMNFPKSTSKYFIFFLQLFSPKHPFWEAFALIKTLKTC